MEEDGSANYHFALGGP